MSDLLPGAILEVVKNTNFRKVMQTGTHMQTVAMLLHPGEDIGLETHEENEQLFIILEGEALAVVGGAEERMRAGDLLCIRPGVSHNLTNITKTDLKLLSIYSPAHHPEGATHKTKQDALWAENK